MTDFVGTENLNQATEVNTHETKDEEGNLHYYQEFSKTFTKVDPHIQDPRSIQAFPNNHTYLLVQLPSGEWTIPSHVPFANYTMDIGLARLRQNIVGETVFVREKEYFPVGSFVEDFREDEVEQNKLLKELNGKKIFIFTAIHSSGEPDIDNSPYVDYQWVPKAKLNKFFTRDKFEKVVHLLSE